MELKFSELRLQQGLFVLFLLGSILERSLSPLLIFPLIWQQKRNEQQLSAQVTALLDRVDENTQAIESLSHQLKKQKATESKQQHQIKTQNTRQNLMLSKTHKLVNQTHQLEREINSLKQRLLPAPSKVVPIQRQTLLAIDGANLAHAARDMGMKIDYAQLKRYINTQFGSLEARIYVGADANNLNQKAWFKHLRQSGYVVKTKPVIWYGNTPKANVDVDVAVDLIADGANFKNVVLCSGDGDYLPAVTELQQQGIKVIVLNRPGQTNHRLRQTADQYISLATILDEIGSRQLA